MSNHDDHYRKIEGSGDPEPIVIQESLLDRLIKEGVDPRRALDIVMGQKHISRAGVKAGEPWEKEIEKAINYLTRGLTGQWGVSSTCTLTPKCSKDKIRQIL